jgi:carbon starvation protein CstA
MLVTLWLMSEGRKYAWAFYPSIFMIVTTIAALLFLAYVNFFKTLPAATTNQASIAAILVGIICLVLVVAALVLVADGWQAIGRARKEKVVEA